MSASYRVALRAYPPAYLERHGAELVATANELADDQWSFRQSRSFFAAGLRARALATSQGQARNLWGQAVLTAMGLSEVFFGWAMLADLLAISGNATGIDHPGVGLVWSIVFLGLFCLHFRSWLAPVLALRVVHAAVLRGELDFHRGDVAITIGTLLLCTAIWITARHTTASRAFAPTTPLAILAVGLATGLTGLPSTEPTYSAMIIIGVIIPALLLFRVDPRPAATAVALIALSMVFVLPMAILSPSIVDRQLLVVLAVSLSATVVFSLLARSGVQRLHHGAI